MVEKKILLISVSVLGICSPNLAVAQSVDNAAEAEQSADGGSSNSSNAIIVTAQRREQTLQDTPLSVNVVSGASLEENGLRDLDELSSRLPAVKIVEGGNADFLNIRGVGSGGNQGFEQSVATFVDGVYRGRSRAIRSALFDLERVEVLKGPQTTFFGNNAIAGALNITTRKPEFDLAVDASALFTPSDGELALQAGVGAPISETLAFRVAGLFSRSDGFIENVLTGEDGPAEENYQGRASLRFEPTSNFRSDLRFDIGDFSTAGAFPFELVNCPPPVAFGVPSGPCAAHLALGFVDDELDYRSASGESFFDYTFEEVAWTNSLNVGAVTLTSITSYFHHDLAQLTQLIPTASVYSNGGGLLPYAAQEEYEQLAQELRLQSDTGGVFDYMVGAYYSEGDLTAPLQIAFNFLPFQFIPPTAPIFTAGDSVGASLVFQQEDVTKSAFASFTVRPTDALQITGSLRYTNVKKTADRVQQYGLFGGAIPSQANFTPLPIGEQLTYQAVIGGSLGQFTSTSRTDDKFQPAVIVQYDISDDIMTYASYTNGFKAGGFAGSSNGEIFGPETVDAYEFGVKASLLDSALSLNLSAFRMDYDDLQESTFVFLPSGTIVGQIGNAAGARSEGIELSASLRASRYFTLSSEVTYLDSRYTDYPLGACTALQSAIEGRSCTQDLSGKRRPYAPEWSGNVSAELIVPAGGYELTVSPSLYFSSDYFQSAAADDYLSQSGFAKLDLRVAFAPEDGPWTLAVIGKNLTDITTASSRNSVSNAPGALSVYPDRPRSVSFQLSYRY